MQPETRFKAKVISKLRSLREYIYFVKIQQKSINGTPDIFMCCSGRFIAWELKVGTNIASPLQRYNIDWIENAGGIARVVTPETLADAMKELSDVILTEEKSNKTKRSRKPTKG